MNEKILLVDGNSIFNRAFYGLLGPKMLSNSDGLYTNAIYGFLNILLKFINEEKPDYLAIAFDMKAPTFRHAQYEKYKANRKGMPDEMAVQMPVLKELLTAMNVKMFEISGFEADDIIGTLAKDAERKNINVVILTGDKDALQIADEKILVKIPITRMGKTGIEEYDNKKVIEKYGVVPSQMIDVKALMGDSSDNIPGVPGIGEKTALELIREYESLDNIYEKLEELNIKERIRRLLLENKELAYMSKSLGTIDLSVPIDINHCDCKGINLNNSLFFELLKKLEFTSIISKLGLSEFENEKREEKKLNFNFEIISDPKEMNKIINKIEKAGEFSYYFNIEGNKNIIRGAAFCWADSECCYIDFEENMFLFDNLRNLFENSKIKKYAFNSKNDYHLLDLNKIVYQKADFDIVIAAYLINPAKENYILYDLALENLGISIEKDSKGLKDNCSAKEFNKISDLFCSYACAIFNIKKVFEEKLKEIGMEKLYYEVELPLTRVLADMEKEGFTVDVEALNVFSKELEGKIQSLTLEITNIAGEDFNINSTKQLGTILFEKLALPVVKKTKTGYSTDVEVLETLASKHPIIDKLLEYRQCVKLKSTYVDGIKNLINSVTNRIHSSFNQTVTVTGRISSTEPNLQNIPIKLEMGKRIRKVFVAQEGCILIDADYSQIELRVLADISGDENMIRAFEQGQDIHRSTASKIFGVSEDEVTPFMRGSAKAINFGLIYGKGEYSLAKDLRIPRKQAKEYIDNYFEKFSRVHQYMDEIIQKAKEEGYVSTLLGRRRYLPEINSSNFNVRAASERMALNTPIQGTAADIIKIAMVKVHKELKERNLKSKLILQVHDELIVEAVKDEEEEVKKLLQSSMESAYTMKVPLEVDLHTGKNWYEAK